jgi:hypothetical protein
MTTVFRAIMDHTTSSGHKYRYESHDCATAAEAKRRGADMGAAAEVYQIDVDPVTGREQQRTKVS